MFVLIGVQLSFCLINLNHLSLILIYIDDNGLSLIISIIREYTIYGMNIKEIIHVIYCDNFFTMAYVLLSAVAIIAMITTRVKIKHRYKIWKRDTLNLGILKREWEKPEDEIFEELFLENQRLENKIAFLKKEYRKLSWKVTSWGIILLLYFSINNLFNKNKSNQDS